MMRGKLKKYFATILVSCTLVTTSALNCMAAESETETAAATEAVTETAAETEAATESVSEEMAELASEAETEAAASSVTSAEDYYKQTAASMIQQIVSLTDEQIAAYAAQGDTAVTSWQSVKDEVGAFVSIGEQSVEVSETELVITSNVQFENNDASVVIYVDMEAGTSDISFDVNYTMAQKMKQAGMNTLMGIGIVFVMLLFLSFLISQFKHVSKLEKKLMKAEAPAPVKPAPAPAPALVVEEEELADDGELVAVIAAAIAAYEGSASTDGFVVRSIKKSNKNKWRRA